MTVPLKLVLVGDRKCGKSNLLLRFAKNEFPDIPDVKIVFDSATSECELEGKPIELHMWNTAGKEEYDRLRLDSYPGTDVVIICIAVDIPESLLNVEEKWKPEVDHYCPGVPVILALLKKDLRYDEDTVRQMESRKRKMVTPEVGIALAQRIGIKPERYIECSAKTREGVFELFETATRAALKTKKPRRTCQTL